MVSKLTTPCMVCGARQAEIAHYKDHSYNKWPSIFNKILCDFDTADFDSYDAEFLGYPEQMANNYPLGDAGESINPELAARPVCPNCHMTLEFQDFIIKNHRRYQSILNPKYFPFYTGNDEET